MSIIIDTPLRNIGSKITASYVGYGTKNVDYPDSYYLKDNTGDPILDSAGNPMLDSAGNPILDSGVGTGEFILDSNGHKILGSVSSPYMLDSSGNIVLDSDDNAILTSNYRTKIIAGIKTQITGLTAPTRYITIQAKHTNIGKIWVDGSGVAVHQGIYLSPGSAPVTIQIDDISKVWFIGNAGEGITFLYGGDEDDFLTDTDEESIQDTDGEGIPIS